MDTHPAPAGDLNDLEHRLAEWRPSSTGLDADGMIFAAGRASVRCGFGRVAWPIVSGCLAVLAGVLLVGLDQERAARRELVARLREQTTIVVPMPSAETGPGESPLSEPPAANSYLASHRLLNENFEAWLVMDRIGPSEGPPPNRPVLKSHSPGDLLDR
jgi:hypothetical protein